MAVGGDTKYATDHNDGVTTGCTQQHDAHEVVEHQWHVPDSVKAERLPLHVMSVTRPVP